MNTIAEGVAVFLSWDELVGTMSILTWALALNLEACRGRGQPLGVFGTFTKTIMWTAVGGPAAAAVSLIGERDTLTLEAAEAGERLATEVHKD